MITENKRISQGLRNNAEKNQTKKSIINKGENMDAL